MMSNKPRLIVFSGAGMSAESGIATFRDTGGLWEQYSIEDVATPDAWRRNSSLVTDFYNQRRKQILETQPNDAHLQLQSLESYFNVEIITQNIDDLHERAGSSNVLHLHGNIRLAKSSGPNPEKEFYNVNGWELKSTDTCREGYALRPHVVWFGEEVPMLEVAAEKMALADYLIVIGTSLNVYPAAGLVHVAPKHAKKFLIDPNAHELNVPVDFEVIAANASEGLRLWQKKMES